MIYNNGFPTSSTYQTVQQIPQIGYTQPMNNQLQNQFNGTQNVQQIQTQPQVQQQFNQVVDERIMVNGLDNVKLYPLAPNRMETLWDIDGKTFYRVTAGATPRIFYYEEVTSPVIQDAIQPVTDKEENMSEKYNMDEYVKIDDVESIVERILKEQKENKIIEPQNNDSEVSEANQKVAKRTMSRTTNKGDK